MLEAKLKAEGEFEKYRVIQDREYESDFDKAVKRIDAPKRKKMNREAIMNRDMKLNTL